MKHLYQLPTSSMTYLRYWNKQNSLKRALIEGEPFKGKSLAMIFEKASTRTRVSFEVGYVPVRRHSPSTYQNRICSWTGEIIEDTARAISRYVDGVMIRAIEHQDVVKFSQYSDVPVINGLTNLEHPASISRPINYI